MLLLTQTTDTIDAVTDTAATIDTHVSYADNDSGAITLGRELHAISTATTTTLCAAPTGTKVRNVKTIHARNKSASTASTITVRFNANATIYELYSVTLRPGECLEYIEGVGFFVLAAPAPIVPVPSTADQSPTQGSANYVTGSGVKFTANPTVGTVIHWHIDTAKTGAGTGTSAFAIYFGPNGTTGDTSRCAATLDTETAIADEMFVHIQLTIRGPITASCIAQALFIADNNLSTTGYSNTARKSQVKAVQSAAFDITGLPLYIGVVMTPGASDVTTIRQCVAEVLRS